jgi:enoyl-CoA hydratase/carnithine racemase
METVNTRDEGAVRVVELDRPDALNAFSSQLMDDLCDAFLDAAADDGVKVLLLTGKGRAFSAGADLKEMGRPPKSPKHGFAALLDAIIDFPKPFMLAVNGMGTGIGATICGLADFVFMSEEARLRCPFSTLGLTAEAGSTVTFPRLMGRQQAGWFLMSSEWMSAAECRDAGLAMAVYAADDLMPKTLVKAQHLAALPLSSLMMTKSLMMEPVRDELKAACERENKGLASLLGSDANKEALAAFMEKREPDFSGL